MAQETITLRLVAQDLMSGNVSKAIGSIDKLAKRGGLVGSVLQGVGQSFGQMLNPAALVAQGIGAVTDALGDSLNAFREDALSQAQLRTALEANIKSWDGNTDAIERTIAARMDLAFSDDEQRASLSLLVAQVQDVNDALAIQGTAMDLARLKGVSLADASNTLAKAYNGSLTALNKMGIKLAAGTKGMGAVAAVQKRAAGQAKAFADTATGASERLNLKIGELQETIGGFINGPAAQFVDWLNDIVDAINGGSGDAAFRELGQRLLDIKNGVADTTETVKDSKGPWESYMDGLQAFNDVMAPYMDEANDFRRSVDDLRKMAGLSEEAVVGMFFSFKDAGHMGADAAKKAVTDLITSMILANETTSVTTPLLSQGWRDAFHVVETAAEGSVLTMETAMARMRQAVKDSIGGALTTMDDMKGPWREAWREYAEYAKDPFNPKRFEDWIKKRAEKATQKAAQAAEDGKGRARRRWQQLANAMNDPVIVALTQINGSVAESLGIIALFKQQTAGLANILPAIGSVFGNDNDGGGHHQVGDGGGIDVGGSSRRSGGRGGRGNNNGRQLATTVNVVHIGSLSERDGADLARTIDDHLQRHRGRKGGR